MLSVDLPAHERLLDRFGDALIAMDEALDILRRDDAAGIRWLQPKTQRLYDEIDEVMMGLCD